MTFVTNQKLANEGAYGVEAGYWEIHNNDSTWVNGKNTLTELGINILIKYKQDFKNDMSIFSTLNLYNNYMDPNKSNRWNIDVDWETGVKFTINKQNNFQNIKPSFERYIYTTIYVQISLIKLLKNIS